jgi:hypothetical protein
MTDVGRSSRSRARIPRKGARTSLPRLRSSTGCHGTGVNSRLFAITANRPLASSIDRE